MLELVVVMAILIVAVSIFSQIVASTAQIRATSHERALAAEAARGALERLRNEDLQDVFDLYNASEADDPEGPGTAPGHRFDVRGLDAREDDVDGMVGEIFFPAVFASSVGGEEFRQMGILSDSERDEADPREAVGFSIGPSTATGRWMLREDVVMPELGMPRDLNGDAAIDVLDHRYDVQILPVCVKVSWKGRYGDRSLQVYTLLTDFAPGLIE